MLQTNKTKQNMELTVDFNVQEVSAVFLTYIQVSGVKLVLTGNMKRSKQ